MVGRAAIQVNAANRKPKRDTWGYRRLRAFRRGAFCRGSPYIPLSKLAFPCIQFENRIIEVHSVMCLMRFRLPVFAALLVTLSIGVYAQQIHGDYIETRSA